MKSERQRNELALANLRLVRAIACQVHAGLPVNVNIDDLTSAGMVALIEAAARYESSDGVPFGSFAKHRIRGAMLDYLRETDWASRDPRRKRKRVEDARERATRELGRLPTSDEVAQRLGVDIQAWNRIKLDLRPFGMVSACTRDDPDDDLPPPDLPDPSNVQSIALESEAQIAVEGAISTLPVRYQKAVRDYYLEDLTMEEVGRRLKISGSRVSQILKAARH